MLLFWRIRYLDRATRQFRNRDLWLDTNELDPTAKAVIEFCHDTDKSRMVRFCHLFVQRGFAENELQTLINERGQVGSVFIHDYFEDDGGNQISVHEMARILTGDPAAVSLPPGARAYDINYILADKKQIRLDRVSLSREQLRLLGYFTRDFLELSESAFMEDGPGTLCGTPSGDPTLETAVTDDEIRSFLTIFRRLYMQGEPSNFLKAADATGEALNNQAIGKWIAGKAREYEECLDEQPHFIPFLQQGTSPFSRKRLIDVYLYTRYAHQPDERRERQYRECLDAVGGRQGMLTWLFLTAVWECSLAMTGAGRVIVDFLERYCQHHKVMPDILDSVSRENPGMGMGEKQRDRIERLLREKAEELAKALWESKGCPGNGHFQFLDEAREQLRKTLE